MDLHGGNIYKYDKAGRKIELDYSSNINPLGISEKFKDIILKNIENISKYPDINYIDLRESISDYNNLQIENVVVGNGGIEILFSFFRVIKPKKVLILAPTFLEYEKAAIEVEADVNFFELKECDNFYPDIDKLVEIIKNNLYDVVVLCNPNNPTGVLIEKKHLQEILNCCENQKTILFVDEAFIDFAENWKENTITYCQSEYLFVMRSLTKFFAIPGLRLGYGISSNNRLISKMIEKQEPWSVNLFANLAGVFLLKDEMYIKNTEDWIKAEKKFFYNKLKEIKGIKVYKTNVNFILLKLNSIKSRELKEFMINEGILIRDAQNFKFLNDTFIRLAIKDRENNIKVLNSLKKVLGVKNESFYDSWNK